MYLIHRNRVDCPRLDRLERSPLRSNLLANIFPQRGRLISVALIDKNEQDGSNLTFTVTVNLTKRMRAESLAPLGKGDRSGSRNEQREFQ